MEDARTSWRSFVLEYTNQIYHRNGEDVSILAGGIAGGKRETEKGLLDRTRFSGGLDRLSSL